MINRARFRAVGEFESFPRLTILGLNFWRCDTCSVPGDKVPNGSVRLPSSIAAKRSKSSSISKP